jgi:hypothetical protein
LPAFNLESEKWEFKKTWADPGSNSYPQKRKFHSLFKVDKYAYLFGGLHTDLDLNIIGNLENCVWRLNFDNFIWQKLDIPMPCLTYFHAATCNKVTFEVF